MEHELWGANYTYGNIDDKSSELDKVNAVINVFSKNEIPAYLDYDKLHLSNTSQQKAFDALLMETGFFEIKSSKNSYSPGFLLTKEGHLMLARNGSYLNYHTNRTTQDTFNRGLEYEERQRKKEVDKLTLEALKAEGENRELKKKIDEELLPLIIAQRKDIKTNAVDRKTVITWQIIGGVSVLVAFLLKLFGVKGWLQ